MNEPILYDTHMHTPLCKHAKGDPEDYAAVAEQRGLKGIIVTCHNPGPDKDFSARVRMAPDEFDDYVALVERARGVWNGRLDIRLGLECDYIPGMEPFLENLLQRAEMHHVLGSIHPQLPYYRKAYDHGDAIRFYESYFANLALAAETRLFDTLSHPDLVKNVYHTQWSVEAVQEMMCASLDRIAKTGVAMELNTSGLNKTIREMNPNPTMLSEMCARNIPVVIGSDAHAPNRVAADFQQALDLLEAAGYSETNFFLNRQRQTVSITAARASLQ
ncbi:MAG: histidinol-phosphatase HisJ family protein [Anaerolineales bacterium]|nr:histidinol-phosphatase HisJ family protein [Anaerolineales bacterium]MCB8991047.1 histidinol-phosphatase HisJ family protein [Ardenticatenaceae bacterium]MCB9004089.1 histidinol-phosphatase HisJ family protein [Ardenticatenaceae bacterium]